MLLGFGLKEKGQEIRWSVSAMVQKMLTINLSQKLMKHICLLNMENCCRKDISLTLTQNFSNFLDQGKLLHILLNDTPKDLISHRTSFGRVHDFVIVIRSKILRI